VKILAIETSTALGSVALSLDGKVIASEFSNNPKKHTEFVNLAVDRILNSQNISLSEVDLYAVGSGPGSFTGLRVAANVAKTFSMLHLKPLVEMNSLALMKEASVLAGESSQDFLCLLNAHKNLLYTSGVIGELIISPSAMTVGQVETAVLQAKGPVLGLGEGFKIFDSQFSSAFKAKIIFPKTFIDFPSAEVLAVKALDLFRLGQTIDWKSYKPLYIRASEAEEKLK
jgi:tRNA threonylcarbamoyladenosine biosynthesis protein TsaB